MTAPDPLVSVIVPTFNGAQWVSEALASVSNQTYQNLEIIVVDDKSTDSTLEHASAKAEKDPRIKVIASEKNSGRPAIPRNVGIDLARGELIAFLDQDDVWFKHKLERQVRALQKNPQLGLVHSHLLQENRFGRLLNLARSEPASWRIANTATLSVRNRIQGSSVMIRANLLRKVGSFDQRLELRTVEDFHLWFRIAHRAQIGFISEVHGLYREHELGASKVENHTARIQLLDNELGTDLLQRWERPKKRIFLRLVLLPLTLGRFVEGWVRTLFFLPPKIFS